MRGAWQQLKTSVRLYFRNRMGMLYGYLFPAVFLIAFYVLYRYERVPLVRHMGELLTVTILGGACLGLATTLVNDRERGVWRRYRLAPVSTSVLVASTLIARYLLLLTAGLLQLSLAFGLGMPAPAHPIQLFAAFSLAAFAFLGLGLVIAMMADNVPAVQALGQTIFLPMLIIGGVAVPLTSLPDWALYVSAYFPGRYAVEAIQATVNGDGLRAVEFSLIALVLIGAAACAAGAGLFRWNAGQRFADHRGKWWLAVAAAGWVGVGLLARWQDRIIPAELARERSTIAAPMQIAEPGSDPSPATADRPAGRVDEPMPPAAPPAAAASISRPQAAPPAPSPPPPAPKDPVPATAAAEAGNGAPRTEAEWERTTMADITANLVFDRLPPDAGVVTPIAGRDEEPPQELWNEIERLAAALERWPPARTPDVLVRARNLLLVAAVVDVFQMPAEAYVPGLVFGMLERDIDRGVLIKALYWIAINPDEGGQEALDQMEALGVPTGGDVQEIRGRLGVYAVKLIGRLTGLRPAR